MDRHSRSFLPLRLDPPVPDNRSGRNKQTVQAVTPGVASEFARSSALYSNQFAAPSHLGQRIFAPLRAKHPVPGCQAILRYAQRGVDSPGRFPKTVFQLPASCAPDRITVSDEAGLQNPQMIRRRAGPKHQGFAESGHLKSFESPTGPIPTPSSRYADYRTRNRLDPAVVFCVCSLWLQHSFRTRDTGYPRIYLARLI